MTDLELKHHGVMGMKWGVRRYQNKDGSLTERGKERFRKVSESERLQKRDTRLAVKAIKNYKRDHGLDRYADYYNKKAEKARNKGDTERYKKYMSYGKKFIEKNKELNKRLDEITSGKLRAGRDFIMQIDYDVLFLGPMVSIGRTGTFIEKKK